MICPLCTHDFTPDPRAGNRAKTCRACRPEYIRRKSRQYAQDIKAGKRVKEKQYHSARTTHFGPKTPVPCKCPKCEVIHWVEWFGPVPTCKPRIFCNNCAWCRQEGQRNETYAVVSR
jgi:DNA-directed RNA polymerase subunit M/transcription elongation factor TFIIS